MIRTVAPCGIVTSVKFQTPCRETPFTGEFVSRRVTPAGGLNAPSTPVPVSSTGKVAGGIHRRSTMPRRWSRRGSTCRSSPTSGGCGVGTTTNVWKNNCGTVWIGLPARSFTPGPNTIW